MTASTRRRGRGGKGGAEPTARVRLREVKAMQMVLEGRTQYDIAQALGVSQPAVSKMLRRIEDRLLADVAWRVERQRARQSLRLEFIYREAIRAWQASQEDALRRRQRRTDGPQATGGTTVAEVLSESRHGDPRFLEEARRSLADLRDVWGIDAPERVAVATNRYAALSEAELWAEIARGTAMLQHPDESSAEEPGGTE